MTKEIDVRALLREEFRMPVPEGAEDDWPPMVLALDVKWHGEDPDVGIPYPYPEDCDHRWTLGGLSYSDWPTGISTLCHVTGLEAHKIDTVISAHIEEWLENLSRGLILCDP